MPDTVMISETSDEKATRINDADVATSYRSLVAGLPWIFVLVGAGLRIRAYLANRSLWLDEAMLAINVLRRSFVELLQPLDHHQAAPVGFLWLEKTATICFGPGEMALRLVPLVASLASLPLFLMLARRMLDARGAVIAIGLFAIAQPLVYFASEAKQYSLDVFFAIAILLSAVRFHQDALGIGRAALLVCVGIAATWFSHPAIFVLAGAGATLFVVNFRKDPLRAWIMGWIGAAWLVSFAIGYWLFMRPIANDPHMANYWQKAFLPSPTPSITTLQTYLKSFFALFADTLELTVAGLSAAAFVLGCAAMLQCAKSRAVGWLVLTPVGFLAAAALMKRYPLDGRLILFITPMLFLLIAAGVESAWKFKIGKVSVGLMLLIMLSIMPVFKAVQTLKFPRQRQEIRPVLEHVSDHAQAGDVVYLYEGSHRAFEYYSLVSDRYVPKQVTLIHGKRFQNDWRAYRQDLDQIDGKGRVWVVFSHVHEWSELNEERLLVHWLDQMGRRQEELATRGASVYLYDLRD